MRNISKVWNGSTWFLMKPRPSSLLPRLDGSLFWVCIVGTGCCWLEHLFKTQCTVSHLLERIRMQRMLTVVQNSGLFSTLSCLNFLIRMKSLPSGSPRILRVRQVVSLVTWNLNSSRGCIWYWSRSCCEEWRNMCKRSWVTRYVLINPPGWCPSGWWRCRLKSICLLTWVNGNARSIKPSGSVSLSATFWRLLKTTRTMAILKTCVR